MAQTSIYLLLAWIIIVLARTQESEDPKILCSSYYPGKAIPGLGDRIKENFQIDTETENLWKTEHLTYK